MRDYLKILKFYQNQDPRGACAAVNPLWINQKLRYERPTINGDDSYSNDLTYIKNGVHANE